MSPYVHVSFLVPPPTHPHAAVKLHSKALKLQIFLGLALCCVHASVQKYSLKESK